MPMDTTVIKARIQDYFSVCDETAEEPAGQKGRPPTRRLPYTLAGLAEHVGMSKGELTALAPGRGRAAEAVAAALRRIERDTVERALMGEISSSMCAMLLEGLGLSAAGKTEGPEAGKIVIVMEDREGWSR